MLNLGLDIVTTAAILFIVSTGLLLVFGVMKIINFSHGAFLTTGGYASVIVTQAGLGWWWSIPFSLAIGMGFTFFGLLLLSVAHQYAIILIAASLVGLGSAVFHPESARIARLASGGRYGFAQSVFQLGGSFGTSMGPVLAALIVVPFGQPSIAW